MSGRALNWAGVEKAASDRKARRQTRRFVIRDGETVQVRFLCPPNEPYMYKRHFANNVGAKGRYLICAEDIAHDGKHDGCVVCAVARAQGKKGAVRYAARVYAFSLLDPRKFHVLGEGDDRAYEECSEDARCKWCKKGDEPKLNGVCHWTVSEAVANLIKTFDLTVLGKRCAACETGTIKVVEYVCPDCGELLEPEDPLALTRCFECDPKKPHMVVPAEVVRCSKGCKDARRTTLADAWVQVTRSGSGTSTTYSFAPGEVGAVDDAFGELTPVEFDKLEEFKAESAMEQAAVLGVANPFKSRKEEDDRIPFDGKDEVEMRAPQGPIFRR
jgi:hypothetical protein